MGRAFIENHSSAKEFGKEVGEFIATELRHDTLLGPFTSIPHSAFHCSPLMTRPKDITKRRVIVDLSYGDISVIGMTDKETYEGIHFQLQLPTLDHVLNQILHLKNPRLIKADISWAFRNVPVDPGDAIKCGIAHEGHYYVDKHLVFGAMNGTMIFQRISDAMLKCENIQVWTYSVYR